MAALILARDVAEGAPGASRRIRDRAAVAGRQREGAGGASPRAARPGDARHLLTFIAEQPRRAREGFVVCRCPRPMRLHDKVTAIPWYCL
jgi:hypothetical protein